jgi:uncharacterized protein YndB with AHSA1/START domain
MAEIRHNLGIKVSPEKIYEAITTQEGLTAWWCKHTVAKPEIGFVNKFTFGDFTIEMKVLSLDTNKRVEWQCNNADGEWAGTNISFDLEQQENRTLLRFSHNGWQSVTDMFAGCSYDWARFLASLKSLCENGTGSPF